VAESAAVSAQNVAQISSQAAVAAATAYAAYAAVPPLAAAMAAEAYGATIAWAPLAVFEKGGIMPETGIAKLHEKEMVLTPSLSIGLQNLVAERQTRATTPPVSIHFAPVVHAYDAQGVTEALRQSSRELAKLIKRQMRRGELPSV
jgi:hypothetical protein